MSEHGYNQPNGIDIRVMRCIDEHSLAEVSVAELDRLMNLRITEESIRHRAIGNALGRLARSKRLLQIDPSTWRVAAAVEKGSIPSTKEPADVLPPPTPEPSQPTPLAVHISAHPEATSEDGPDRAPAASRTTRVNGTHPLAGLQYPGLCAEVCRVLGQRLATVDAEMAQRLGMLWQQIRKHNP